jgi:hypothetical protein
MGSGSGVRVLAYMPAITVTETEGFGGYEGIAYGVFRKEVSERGSGRSEESETDGEEE